MITDQKSILITIKEHGNFFIQDLDCPSVGYLNEEFEINFTLINSGEEDNAFIRLKDTNNNELYYEEMVVQNGSVLMAIDLAFNSTGQKNLILEVGYN